MDWNDVSATAVILFLIMDPFGNAPIFYAILAKLNKRRRGYILIRELLIALVILFTFLAVGNRVMDFLGLTQPSLNIAGGILLFVIALNLIFPSSTGLIREQEVEDPFIVPLAVPMLAGPSTIAMLMLLRSNHPDRLFEWSLALVLAWFATAVVLLISPWLLNLIGSRGSKALERLMGMILIILASQILLNGIRNFIQSL